MSNPIIFNGKTYNSVDEMPADVRALYETMSNLFADKNQNGVPDIMEGAMQAGATIMQTSGIVYEGKTYASADELPAEARSKYDEAMKKLADNNQNGVPDILEGAMAQQPMMIAMQSNVTPTRNASPAAASTQGLGPIIVLGIVAVVLAIVVGILLLLLVAGGRAR